MWELQAGDVKVMKLNRHIDGGLLLCFFYALLGALGVLVSY